VTAEAAPRILVAEDEFLLAMMLEEFLEERQCAIIGPFAKLAPALDAAEREPISAAILDWNLAGESIVPVARTLERRGIPFLFLTGYGAALDSALATHPVVAKPFTPDQLAAAFERLLATAPTS
jgi:DNA-binding response OmpR family regulator